LFLIKYLKSFFILKKIKQYLFYKYYCLVRSRISFFDYQNFNFEIPFYSQYNNIGHYGNRCYGNYYALKNAFRENFIEDSIIEHGIYFGENILIDDYKDRLPKVIYTYGDYRFNVLKSHEILSNLQIIKVGPFIKYATSFYSTNELKSIKDKLGKTLTIFPVHSYFDSNPSYVLEGFRDSIKTHSANYDTILVCIYWVDIVNGLHNKFLSLEKVKIVCAGTRNDPYFLGRLKNIIELSDMTMTNAIGTHIGYCVSLNKPLFYYNSNVKWDNSKDLHDGYNKEFYNIFYKENNLFLKEFGDFNTVLTSNQINLVKYYWGEF
jgi:hypothetical protein